MERKNCKRTNNVKFVKESNGITLIALVITIIVLLILAGVTIATLTGENGILTRANDAKEKTEQAEKDEKTNLSRTEDLINQYVGGIEVEQVTDENPGVLETDGNDTYVINSIEDLVVFASNVREGNTYEGQTVKLGLSLDFNSTKSYVDAFRTDYEEYGYDGELKTLLTSGEGFKPIGTTYDADISTNYFSGTFDGEYNVICNLHQNIENSDQTIIGGFFSTNNGVIMNLKLENVNIIGTSNNSHLLLGAISGRNNGDIQKCSATGQLELESNSTTNNYIGGLIGQNMGTISKCFNKSNLNIYSNKTNLMQDLYLSGIAGGNFNIINECYNVGTLIADLDNISYLSVAGISGGGTISNCYNVGNIYKKKAGQSFTSEQNIYISGIGGINCESNYNIGEIIIESSYAGYASGITSSTNVSSVNNCCNIGKISSTNSYLFIGSIMGWTQNECQITNSKWLKDTADLAISNKGQNVLDNSILVENINDMPDILSIVGNEFKEDTNNINNGNPLLNWQ